MPTLTSPLTTDSPAEEFVHDPIEGHESERFSHYVLKEKIGDAVIYGTPVEALCGKKWVPSRDGSKYPVCPECKELLEMGPEGRLRRFEESQS